MVDIRSEIKKEETKAKEYWHTLGPGLTAGAAGDDPAGITTYSQSGAAFGYKMLWTAALTFPLMAVIQEMCARIGLATGRGLASSIRIHYSRKVLFVAMILLFIANTFNIGANLGMMAEASQLLLPDVGFLPLVIVFALGSLWMQIVLAYKNYAQYLKWLALTLFVYVFAGFVVDVNWNEAMKSLLVPNLHLGKDELLILTAVLGTTISPYLFFWQTSQEVEEQILEGKKTIKQRIGITAVDAKKMRVDVWSGMFFSNLVMFFIIAVCAATLHQAGITNIANPSQAALALKPLVGNAASLFFTLGILGTGLLAVPVLAGSSSYAISEYFGWREGLYRKFKQAHAFYGVIIFSVILGLFMNFLGFDPVKMLIYSAVLNGFVAPFFLVLIVLLATNKQVMKEWVNGRLSTTLGILIILMMLGASFLTIWSQIS
jgi:NRAMP (natural resistance-associated macrophage protein)-like metal ion transporter